MNYNKIEFMGERLSASEIGRRYGLSPATILKRHAQGYKHKALVAPPGGLPKAPDGEKFVYRSTRLPTVLQALARLRSAKKTLMMAHERLAHAKAMGERRNTIARLEKEVRRAEARRMYCTSMLETAEERKAA